MSTQFVLDMYSLQYRTWVDFLKSADMQTPDWFQMLVEIQHQF